MYPTLVRWIIFMPALLAIACGANEAASGPPESTAPPVEAPVEPTAADPVATEVASPAEIPEDPPSPVEPEAEPIDVEAGTRLGPIRIGMSLDDVRALGLDEAVVDPRTTRYGPYRISFRDGSVRRVEASMGDLERIRFGDRVIESGTHISEIRDAFGDCTWTEGGGERYVCADGTLYVRTTHSMAPDRYTVGITAR